MGIMMMRKLWFGGLLALALFAPPARAANFWFDFNHDGLLSTIQPYSSRSVDTLLVVLDPTGAGITAPFSVSWQSQQQVQCFPNQGYGGVATLDTVPGGLPAEADSFTITDVSPFPANQWTQFTVHFKQVPAGVPFIVARLLVSYPNAEQQPCPNAGTVAFPPATVSQVGQVGGSKLIKIKDTDVPVRNFTWGQLHWIYR